MPFSTLQRISINSAQSSVAESFPIHSSISKLPRCTVHDVPLAVAAQHGHSTGQNQCCSVLQQIIDSPLSIVWSLLSSFDRPQDYKQFVRSCRLLRGNGRRVGTVREVRLVSGLPATTSQERLEILDEQQHVLSFRVVGGDHRLVNYRSITTLHSAAGDNGGATVVVESYVVDVPPGNLPEDTRAFADTIVRCNLRSLARTAEKTAERMRQPEVPLLESGERGQFSCSCNRVGPVASAARQRMRPLAHSSPSCCKNETTVVSIHGQERKMMADVVKHRWRKNNNKRQKIG